MYVPSCEARDVLLVAALVANVFKRSINSVIKSTHMILTGPNIYVKQDPFVRYDREIQHSATPNPAQ